MHRPRANLLTPNYAFPGYVIADQQTGQDRIVNVFGNTSNRINNNSCSCVSKPALGILHLDHTHNQQAVYKNTVTDILGNTILSLSAVAGIDPVGPDVSPQLPASISWL